jgi:hypothetical protein
MFEKSSRMKIRFSTHKGLVSVEDLWDMSLGQLNVLAKDLNRSIKEASEVDFLSEKTVEDTTAMLKFDVVLHILNKKKEEREQAVNAAARREEKQQLLDILARKKAGELEQTSIEDLEKRIAALSS